MVENIFDGYGDGDGEIFFPAVTVTVTKNQDFTVTVTAHGDVSPSCPGYISNTYKKISFVDTHRRLIFTVTFSYLKTQPTN